MNVLDFHKKKQIPNLDGLRAIAILLVLIHHIPLISISWLHNLQANAHSGVALFFVISGFLISTLALREMRETGHFSLRNFYIRRTLRLFPLYYAVLAIACFLVFYLNVFTPDRREIFHNRLLSYIFFYSNLYVIDGPFSLLWSLAVEEQFYFMFSMLFFFLGMRITGLFCLTILLMQIQPFVSYNPTEVIPSLIIKVFDFFEPIFMGILLAYALNTPTTFRWFQQIFHNSLVLMMVSAGILYFLFSDLKQSHVYYACLTLLVGICALSPSLPVVGGKLMSHIGKISYGIYLIHTIIFFGLKDIIGPSPFWVLVIGTPIVIGAATLIYNYFEKPILKYKEKFCVVHPVK